MNIATFLGTIVGIAVVAYTVLSSADNPAIFADVHGIVIVIGGTITVTLLSFPIGHTFAAAKIVFRKMFMGTKHNNYGEMISTIVQTAQVYRTNPKGALDQVPDETHPFFQDGMKLLVEYGFGYDDLDEILTTALDGKKKRDQDEIKVWHTISRFPPAFGLLGATVGMISLLQTLGEPGAQDRIGPAMATALVATFYGLVTANLFLLPVTENLSEVSRQDVIMRNIIKEGVLLIQQKKHPLYIEEYLKAFLSPKQREEDFSEAA